MRGQKKQSEKEMPSGTVKADTPQASVTGEQTTANKLTPEEQMALYEKDLKENDWGHQPC